MTPGETARNEAAKQAVVLVFAVLGAVAMLPLYRRITEAQAAAMRQVVDPTEAQRDRMRGHLESAKRWDRVASACFLFGTQRAFWWAHDKAEKSRAAYEAERP